MNDSRKLLNTLIACGVALATISTVFAQSPSQGAATVVRIKGSARYTTGGNDWHPLRVGAVLHPGTVVQTGLDKGSYVDLVLGTDVQPVVPPSAIGPAGGAAAASGVGAMAYQATSEQNVVRDFENTVLGVDKLTSLQTGADVITETQLDLKSGHILGSVKKMSAASKYEVKLPHGVAGIRGTVYDITSDGVVQVSSGSVVVAWVAPDGTTKTQVVMAGEQFDIRSGQSSRISSDVGRSMESAIGGVTTGLTIPTSFRVNQTIEYISPVQPEISPTDGGIGGGE